jgi:hypothetical protein
MSSSNTDQKTEDPNMSLYYQAFHLLYEIKRCTEYIGSQIPEDKADQLLEDTKGVLEALLKQMNPRQPLPTLHQYLNE